MKAYWDFKPGSWWAYQDSATGAIDTVKVLENINVIDTGVQVYGNKTIIYEFLGIKTYNTGDGYYTDYNTNTLNRFITTPEVHKTYKIRYNSISQNGNIGFVYPLIIGIGTGVGLTDTTIVRNHFDTYLSFADTYLIENTYDVNESGNKTKFYFAKNIGIIRYEVPAYNKVKNLISYYLIH